MTYKFTDEQISTTIHEVVDEFGSDYVYPDPGASECLYIANGKPSCIVGHVLVRLGVKPDELSLIEGSGVGNLLMGDVIGGPEFDVSEEVAEALDVAQSLQDAGDTWGKALEHFDSNMSILNSIK